MMLYGYLTLYCFKMMIDYDYDYVHTRVHGKNDFAEVSKNLATDLKIILLDRQNNCVRLLN